jgi:hypothetical protein
VKYKKYELVEKNGIFCIKRVVHLQAHDNGTLHKKPTVTDPSPLIMVAKAWSSGGSSFKICRAYPVGGKANGQAAQPRANQASILLFEYVYVKAKARIKLAPNALTSCTDGCSAQCINIMNPANQHVRTEAEHTTCIKYCAHQDAMPGGGMT